MKILVVEDDALVALDLADLLNDLGHDVVGPFGALATACPACRNEAMDFALLDFNLGGETSAPLADRLAERLIPFVFLTGYRPGSLPARFREAAVLSKPVHPAVLARVLDTEGRGGG